LSKKYRILLALFKRRGNKKQIQILNQINMKQLFLILALAFSLNAYSQDIKNVTLVVSGQGKTQEEAKQNALRSAIEQAFGTFISSKTEILNDDIVKDEIVSVANGSIQNFEIISETQIPNDGYSSSLKATVSVTKLTSYVESKGIAIEFKGGIFAANMRQKTLMEEAKYCLPQLSLN
jgi:predicted RNase H-like HicB family nuclease